MKTFWMFAIVAILSVTTVQSTQSQTITLLHVNDTHSHLDAFGPKDSNLNGTIGGIAKAATVINGIRASEPNVLLLHAGDVFQGDLFFNKYFGVPELKMMRQMGFDAMAVGNHEFDLGPSVLNDVLTTAFADGSFPVLSANLDMSAYPALATWVQASTMKTVAGVKIGIFGMTVPGNPTNMPAPVVIQDDIVGIAQQTASSLRASGAQVVICLSHLGVYLDKIVATYVQGIDFIIGGHDHLLFEQPIPVRGVYGQTTHIFQAGEHYRFIGKLRFTVQDGQARIVNYATLALDSSVPAEPTVQSTVDVLKAGIVQQYGNVYTNVVGTAQNELGELYNLASPVRDTPLGNLITDAYRARTNTDIAITPNGLISERIYPGPIVAADVFRAVSYGFDEPTGLGLRLATIRLLGAELLKGLEISLSQLEITEDFSLQVSGMTFNYNSKRPVGHRVTIGSIRINGRPFIPVARYTVTLNTGLLMLLSAFGVQVENTTILPDFEYDIVRNYITGLGMVRYQAEGRIQDIGIRGGSNQSTTAEAGMGNGAEKYALLGCYPNPFNPSTLISFILPERSHIVLRVYNALGQEVKTLVDENRDAGVHQSIFHADGLASGVYFYRLETQGFTQVKKMMLVR